MSLSALLGPIDLNAAIFMSVAAIAVCVVLTTAIAKRRSSAEVDRDFALQKLKVENEDKANARTQDRQREYDLGKLAMQREVEVKRIDAGMIEGNAKDVTRPATSEQSRRSEDY